MINYDYIEFSKIYKRVMDVELKIKQRMKIVLKIVYPTKMFSKLSSYIKENLKGKHTQNIYNNKGQKIGKRDVLMDLNSSKKTEEEKLNIFLHTAYLSDVVNILTIYPKIYKDKKFTDNFYRKKIDFNELKKYASLIIKLRNVIMHFNITDYQINKKKFSEALEYWEKFMSCEICFIHNIKIEKPTTKKILLEIKRHCTDFTSENDRYICEVFDEVALSNGLSIQKLPKYWTIGRQIYALNKNDINEN